MSGFPNAGIVVPDKLFTPEQARWLRTMNIQIAKNVASELDRVKKDPARSDQREAFGLRSMQGTVRLDQATQPSAGQALIATSGKQAKWGGAGSLASVDVVTASTAGIGTTTLLAVGHAPGIYEVYALVEVTTAGGAGCTVTATLGWTDHVGATTANLVNALGATGTTRGAGNGTIYSTGAAALTYATSIGGTVGGLVYNVYFRTTFLG